MSTVELRRTLSYPIAHVWRGLTEPPALAAWFWPDRFATTVEADARVGGRYRIASAPMDMAVAGAYAEVSSPTRLAFTWRWEGDPDETRVTIDLTPAGDGTGLVLRHEGFADDPDRDNHVKGWSDCLDRLPGWLARALG